MKRCRAVSDLASISMSNDSEDSLSEFFNNSKPSSLSSTPSSSSFCINKSTKLEQAKYVEEITTLISKFTIDSFVIIEESNLSRRIKVNNDDESNSNNKFRKGENKTENTADYCHYISLDSETNYFNDDRLSLYV